MSLDRRALVVDDDAGIRLLVRRVLARNGFIVDVARDGAEAIEHILANDYSVIVLDVMMPRLDGRAVIRYVEEHIPDKLPQIIVMSAFGAAVREDVCPPVGRFLEKPFDIGQLVREVTECCWMGAS